MNCLASESDPKSSGNSGPYFNVWNSDSEYGLSLDTRGRGRDRVTSRSASSTATVVLVIDVPRSACTTCGTPCTPEDLLHQFLGQNAGFVGMDVDAACGLADAVALLITDSVSAARMFDDESLAWVHIDAIHDYESVRADIAAWARKVGPGGWLSGDDYHPEWWPGVVAAVDEALTDAREWTPGQWRWIKDNGTA